MVNVCTYKMKVITEGNSLKNSLSRRTRKAPNLEKMDFFDVLISEK